MNTGMQILLSVAAAVAAIGVIWHQLIRPLWRSLKRGEQVWESVNTIEPFQAEVREFMVEMREHRDFVNHELNYNSGSSVKDMTRAGKEAADAAKAAIEHHINTPELHRPFQVNVNTNDNSSLN
jgi:biopolymer transport protein ExbB/TolQ